ncbi:MAG TPA: hypothetical protein VFO38_06440 [Candidatus Saccharimonadales bacterium]|nr:hypothetical protein [Candidatus Saccharimonadales bacterium]
MDALRITVSVDRKVEEVLGRLYKGENDGYCVDFIVFDDIPASVAAVATGCRVVCPTAEHRYALGTFDSDISVDEHTLERVRYNVTGRSAVIDAKTVAGARAAWQHLMACVAAWRPNTTGFNIRVFAEADNPLTPIAVGDGRGYADFPNLESVPTTLVEHALTVVVESPVPDNCYQLSSYTVCEDPTGRGDRAKVTATGMSVKVASTSLSFAWRVFNLYLGGLPQVPTGCREEQQAEFRQLRNNAVS